MEQEEEKPRQTMLENIDILKQLKPERETWLPEDKARVINYEHDRGR